MPTRYLLVIILLYIFGYFFLIQKILVAVKVASRFNPVFLFISFKLKLLLYFLIKAELRLHCQLIAGIMGLPFFLSQTTKVSVWFEIPTDLIFLIFIFDFLIIYLIQKIIFCIILTGSCSTQPSLVNVIGIFLWLLILFLCH